MNTYTINFTYTVCEDIKVEAKNRKEAVYGKGFGLQGSSYAIPTKDEKLKTLPIWNITLSVMEFIAFATKHPESTFNVTRVGCGLAGYTEGEIAPLFHGAPKNVILPKGWRDWKEQ